MEDPRIYLNRYVKKRKGYFRYIQRTIEFYLSDANLRRDRFLKNQLNANLGKFEGNFRFCPK